MAHGVRNMPQNIRDLDDQSTHPWIQDMNLALILPTTKARFNSDLTELLHPHRNFTAVGGCVQTVNYFRTNEVLASRDALRIPLEGLEIGGLNEILPTRRRSAWLISANHRKKHLLNANNWWLILDDCCLLGIGLV